MLDTIRRWLVGTRLERELREENERLQAEVNKLQDEANDWFRRCSEASRKLDADRGVHERAVAALGAKLEGAIAERETALARCHAARHELRGVVQILRTLEVYHFPEGVQEDRPAQPAEEAKP